MRNKMVLVKIDEVPEKINTMISMVEKGEVFIITKEGKPIAEILPLKNKSRNWKRKIEKITLPEGISTQTYIEEERNLR
jgi:antitoxin (DNA-binding transcriptional repressor) of toxin-antitoxin stability system